jgi:integrase
MREEIIARNVAKLVQVPTPKYRVGRGLPVEEARKLLAAARDDRLHALYVLTLYVLTLYLGLRRAELLGLRWSAVDLDAGTLEVVQTLQRVDGRLCFMPPKTNYSARTVPLPSICVRALREHREIQRAEREAAGEAWQEYGLIFTTKIGTPIEPDNLRRSWEPLRERLTTLVRFRDLRHTRVSLLLDLGVPPHIVREIVGHSAIEVTMTIYAHASWRRTGVRFSASTRTLTDTMTDVAVNGCRQARPADHTKLHFRRSERVGRAGSNRRASAFQVKTPQRCADLRPPTIPTSETPKGGLRSNRG